MDDERLVMTVRCAIDARDRGLRKLLGEFRAYKREFIPHVQEAVREVIKDRSIGVYSQQKWMIDQKLTRYVSNLPLHPMPFHNQSVWVEVTERGYFRLHLKTREGEAVCYLIVPRKYRGLLAEAAGRDNTVLGQAELIEDKRYGRMNVHLTMRLPKPEPYETDKWVGVDVGWNCLAVSALITPESITNVTFHGKHFKTRIIQLKYLLRQHQRAGRAWRKWGYRLRNVVRNVVGCIAKEIVEKAKKHKARVVMEDLAFRAQSKRWLIPRYKLMIVVKTLCERGGVPFKTVDPRNTSITCNRCGYKDRRSRNGKVFRCLRCGYEVNADLNAAVNIGRAAISKGQVPRGKDARLYAEAGGEVATPINPYLSPMRDG